MVDWIVYIQQILNFNPSATDAMIPLLWEQKGSSTKKWFYEQKETKDSVVS